MLMTVARCRFRNESSDSIESTLRWFSCLKMFMNLLIKGYKHELTKRIVLNLCNSETDTIVFSYL